MNSEKVKEIKKSLECCIVHGQCDCCIFREKHPFACLTEMHKQLLTLINELENVNKWLLCKVKEKNNEIDNYTKENQQLKARIAELEEDKEKWQRKAINYYQRAKSYGIECIIDTDIDERLKECLGK